MGRVQRSSLAFLSSFSFSFSFLVTKLAMRQRITFFPPPERPVDPALLHLTDTLLEGPAIEATREDRVTLALDQLPPDLARILADGVHELHIRWASPAAYETVSPLFARVSPGLHVFYTPKSPAAGQTLPDAICLFLHTVFGPSLDCRSLRKSFTALGTGGRFSHAAAYQYYAALDDLSGLAAYAAASHWCPGPSASSASSASTSNTPCPLQMDLLDSARSLDLSYDAISHAVKVTTFWPLAQRPVHVASLPGARTEVGILAADSPQSLEPYELGMAGHVAVLGQDSHPSPVLFAFPSRHRDAEGAAFSAAFLEPTGLHPTLQLRITSGPPPRESSSPDDDGDDVVASSCRLHAYLTLPRHIFADKYQLSDPLFLASKNLTALHHTTQPVDLEAPDYAVSTWGSAILVELAPPAEPKQTRASTQDWTAEIPLHLRYLQPADDGYRDVDVPYPAVFWACAAEDGTKFPTNPFDRVNLGYDGLFGPRTEFWHVAPNAPVTSAAGSLRLLKSSVHVPVLDASRIAWVNAGTAAVVLAGFTWVLWKLLAVYRKGGYGRTPRPAPSTTEKKTL